MKKALIIRLSSLGDIIFNIPLANVLKKNGYEVSWITTEKGIDVVKNNPAVDKVFLVPLKKWKQNRLSIKNIAEFFKLIKEIRSEHYDIALDTQMMFKSMVWLRLSGAKRRICREKGKEYSHLGGNEHIERIPNEIETHAIFHHMQFAKHLNLDGTDEVKFTLPQPTAENKDHIDKLLKNVDKSKPLVIIAPATTRKLKHWNKDNWKTVVDAIKDKCSLVFTGGGSDNELISYISEDKFLNLAGKTNIMDLIELFSRAKIILAPDAGSAHLARATNIPAVISIFCCTPPKMYGPFGDDNKYFALNGKLPCQPCHNTKVCPLTTKDAEKCIDYPKPDEIINIVNKLLQN